MMKAIILAAGEGKRMRPLTYTRPKVMLPLAGKPILEHLLLELKAAGITQFVFVVGYRDETIRGYFGDGGRWGVRIEYATQRKQIGTGDALKTVEGMTNETFLVMNGDICVGSDDLRGLIGKGPLSLATSETDHPERVGIVEVAGDHVMGIEEKSRETRSNVANAGMYFLDRRMFDALATIERSPRGEFEITDALKALISEGHPIRFHRVSTWLDLGYPWELLAANRFFLEKLPYQNTGTTERGATIKDNVSIGEGTLVRAGSYIEGPVSIGKNCDIGPNCFIRPATSIGDGCHIGASVEVKNSIVMNGTKIPHHNYVGDSVIGENVNLGAGTKIANLRLDGQEISVAGVPTGLHKLGAIIGDEVKTGINASINVGTLIGDHAFIGPGAIASGIIQPGARTF